MKTQEELQLEWDTLLIQARFSCMDTNMEILVRNFQRLYGKLPHEFGLKRVPYPDDGGYFHTHSTLRFMCAYLPKIADYCWKHTAADREKVLSVVNKSNHDTRKVAADASTRGSEKRDLERTSKAKQRASKFFKEFHENFDAHKLSNQWGVCK